MAEIVVANAPPIRREIQVPGDKSMSHRAVLFAGMAEGTSRVKGFLPSEDCLATAEAMVALGAGVLFEDEGRTELSVRGTAMAFTPPKETIDCGNSGTSMRLLTGVLGAQPFASQLSGDASLTRRPMKRVIDPLRRMGVVLEGNGERGLPPLVISGAPDGVAPLHYSLPVASAQVKSAVLLAGLFAEEGVTSVTEPAPTRDHTERMLEVFGVSVDWDGATRAVRGGQVPKATEFTVPGDISSAAFWLVAAGADPGSELTLPNVGLNPTRDGVLAVLKRMGAMIEVQPSESGEAEPSGTLRVRGGALQGTTIGGQEIANVIDELPVLAVAGALASGETVIKDAAELRVKESDRIAEVAQGLAAMGADVTEFEDGMRIRGGRPLSGVAIDASGDHRIAMAFAVAGLFADGETVVQGTECVATSYPGFEPLLESVIQGRGAE